MIIFKIGFIYTTRTFLTCFFLFKSVSCYLSEWKHMAYLILCKDRPVSNLTHLLLMNIWIFLYYDDASTIFVYLILKDKFLEGFGQRVYTLFISSQSFLSSLPPKYISRCISRPHLCCHVHLSLATAATTVHPVSTRAPPVKIQASEWSLKTELI